jgi:acyl-CoA thioesterase II
MIHYGVLAPHKLARSVEMADLPDILQLDDLGGGRFRIHMPSTSAEGRDVVFSGQYLAQMLMAADRVHNSEKDARSIHAVFARAATYTKPIELVVDTVLDGRSWGNDTITAIQDGKVTARSEVLLNIVEDDLLRHELTSLPLPGPDQATPTEGLYFPGVEVRQVEDEKLEIDGAPAMATWFRYPTKLDSVAANQAVLAWGTCGALIGLAMRGSEAVRISQAHVSISTGVIAHTVHFVERFDVSNWLQMTQHVIHAGHGRVHGRGLVHTEDGRLVASFHQDAMARKTEAALDPRRSM